MKKREGLTGEFMLEWNSLVNPTNTRVFEEAFVCKLVVWIIVIISGKHSLSHKLLGSELKIQGIMDFLFNSSMLSAVALQDKKLWEKPTVVRPEETCLFSVMMSVIETCGLTCWICLLTGDFRNTYPVVQEQVLLAQAQLCKAFISVCHMY